MVYGVKDTMGCLLPVKYFVDIFGNVEIWSLSEKQSIFLVPKWRQSV